jgi:hypothetical protein
MKTNKKCIKLQSNLSNKNNEIDKLNNNELESCKFCFKVFDKYNLKRHLDTCKKKKEKYINDLVSENEELKLNKNELSNEINILKAKLEIFEKLHEKKDDVVIEIAKQPKIINKTNNKNSHISNNHFTYFNEPDKVKEIIKEKLTMNDIVDGQKGLAEFTYNNFLKDEEGKTNYLCGDPSRKAFKFLKDDGDFEKDNKAKRLTDMILAGNIKKQTILKATEFWTNEDGSHNDERYTLHNPSAQEIVDIDKDNSKFVNHLATITSR